MDENAASQWDHGGPSPGEVGSPRLDASTTVNPFPSPALVACLESSLGSVRSYPDPWASLCREAIGNRHSLPIGRIVVAPGATLLLYHLIGTGFFQRLILPEPVFSEYSRAAREAGIPIVRIPPSLELPLRTRGGTLRWGIDPGGFAERVHPGDLLVLVNPVNPTGQEFPSQTVLGLADRVNERGGVLLVDESFQDFVDNRSSVLVRSGESGLVVLRSLTKISGLPGIRTGFLAGRDNLITRIQNNLGPWSTGYLEQELIRWSMRQRTAEEFGWRNGEKMRLMSLLENLGISYVQGEGPMILASPGWDSEKGKLSRKRLAEKGVRIRLAEGFGPSDGATLLRIGFEAFSKTEEFLDQLGKWIKSEGKILL